MTNKKIPFTKLETTKAVQILRMGVTDLELCEIIGISKPTLYTRLKNNNWKKTEITHIQNLKKW